MSDFREQLVEFIEEHAIGRTTVGRDPDYLEINPVNLANALIETELVKVPNIVYQPLYIGTTSQGIDNHRCTVCLKVIEGELSNYCPHCGVKIKEARMEDKKKLTFEQECNLIANGDDLPEDNEKDSQIKEMAKIIENRLIAANNVLGSMNKGEGYWIAEELLKYYQPKLPDHCVVVDTKENPCLTCPVPEDVQRDCDCSTVCGSVRAGIDWRMQCKVLVKENRQLIRELINKERATVEKFVNDLINAPLDIDANDDMYSVVDAFGVLHAKIRELAEQYGVEIKEDGDGR